MIRPKCDSTGKELFVFSALLFSPPDKHGNVKKFHVSKQVYKDILRRFRIKNRNRRVAVRMAAKRRASCSLRE